jgi:hypothetical protein
MIFRLVQDLAARGVRVAVACRVLRVSASGYYQWRGRPLSARARADQALTVQIREIHAYSRGTYGAPRVHAELRLGRGVRCGRKRVARLMRTASLCGIYRRRRRRTEPAAPVHGDLVQRRFVADRPDRLWLTDITEHPTREGKVYLAAVLDVYARRIVGWSMADHLRSELVVDALEMAPASCARPDRAPLRPWRAVHLLGLWPAAASGGAPRLDGPRRLGPRQRDDGVLLQHAPARAA